MRLFLDENIRNRKLILKLKKMGIKVITKEAGLSDYDLEDWLVKHDDIVMVTRDIQFDMKFVEKKSYLIDTNESIAGCVILIKHFMSQFEQT